MRKVFLLYLLLLPLGAFTQTVYLGVSKDLVWAEWFYESLEFRDDCTILRGYFIPSGNGCWVRSKMDETLKADGKEYRLIFTTLPINRHPRIRYKGGNQVNFEERFEPIFSTGGIVQLTTHDISFSVPLINRKATKIHEHLLSAYEYHIDTLMAQGKYSRAAYLLNQYAKKSGMLCSLKAKKRIAKRILSKYRVLDFFLNASSDDQDICTLFKNTYYWLDFNEDDEILKDLEEINKIQWRVSINMNSDHFSNVIKWCEELLSMIRKYGKYNKCYKHSLSLYRRALIKDGQTQNIPDLDNEIIDVCKHIYDINDGQYLDNLMNIASDLDINFTNTSYESYISINIWKEVRDKAKQNLPNSWIYASALQQIADYNYHYRHYDVALMQYLTIDSLYKEMREKWISEVWANHDFLSVEQSVTYMNLFHKSLSRSIGYCYYHKGEIVNAIKHDVNNPYYHCTIGDYETVLSWCKESYQESIEGLKGIIKKPTIIKPGAYYEEVFDLIYSPALTTHIPYFAYKTNSCDLYEEAYNGALITKEFRLTAGKRLQHYLRSTQDSVSKEYINQIDQGICTYQSMVKTQDLYSQEKYWEVVQLQRKLIVYLDSIGALETYFPNWTEVRNALKDHEIAIEFIEFPLWNQDQSIYAALTLRKDSEHPKMITLFEDKQLKSISDTAYYQCREMTNLVWNPLRAELEGINEIYFSPSGALYNIGIEYLPDMEDYNIHRLSSTRELVAKKETTTINRAVLYGGLDYYAKLDTIGKGNSFTSLNEIILEHSDVRGMKLRGGKDYLPHTKDEVEQIENVLRRTHWTCIMDTAAIGTEESFKSLSGKNVRLLHIATHGFYYTPEEANNIKYDFMQLSNSIVTNEDKALTRSGLVMSGANHILEGETLPNNVEDGILTAKEIANVDLHGLDLVVLSACQTGLGDISQGEGVFGLQRGFKKAGVNTILMSLWEVDDKATQILMTQFYKNRLSGKSKQQSLKSAQKYLREYNNGYYNDPKYWAAFILLDGIDS